MATLIQSERSQREEHPKGCSIRGQKAKTTPTEATEPGVYEIALKICGASCDRRKGVWASCGCCA